MAYIMNASFEKPKMENWKDKYAQLDFLVSIDELEKLVKSLKNENRRCPPAFRSKKTKWLLLAFAEKCGCEYCKPCWKAFEDKLKEVEKINRARNKKGRV